MDDLESYKLWHVLAGVTGLVVLYYLGTRGVLLLTRQWSYWGRRAAVTLSYALLFAPSMGAGGGHGGILPMPAWMASVQYVAEEMWNAVFWYGIVPVLVTWAVFLCTSAAIPLNVPKQK